MQKYICEHSFIFSHFKKKIKFLKECVAHERRTLALGNLTCFDLRQGSEPPNSISFPSFLSVEMFLKVSYSAFPCLSKEVWKSCMSAYWVIWLLITPSSVNRVFGWPRGFSFSTPQRAEDFQTFSSFLTKWRLHFFQLRAHPNHMLDSFLLTLWFSRGAH